MEDPKKYFKLPEDPTTLTNYQRRYAALQMKLAGLPFTVIAELLGESLSEVINMITSDLKSIRRTIKRAAKALYAAEWERLEALTYALWPQAMNGNIKAVEAMLKLMDRRAKMMGLDAPTKIEQKTDQRTVQFNLDALSDQELLLKAQQMGLALTPAASLPQALPGVDLPQAVVTAEEESLTDVSNTFLSSDAGTDLPGSGAGASSSTAVDSEDGI